MQTSAIQSDVQVIESTTNQEIDKSTTQEPVKSPRELAMEGLTAKRNENFEEEAGVKLAQPAAKAAEEEDDNDDDTTASTDQLDKQLNDDSKILTDGLDKTMVRVKVDGVEREVSVAEMQRTFQKNEAADKRLAEATRLLREAQEAQLRAQTENALTNVKKPSDTANNTDTTSTATEDEAGLGKEFLKSLFEGDEDKALAALTKLTAGRQASAPILDEAELAKKLTPAIKQQLVVESASDKFKADYPDIVGDPYLANVADGFLDSFIQEGKPFAEALEAAGKKTRDWLHEKAGVKKTEPERTTTRNEKLDRKSAIDNVTGTTVKAVTNEEPVASASQTIAEMRKARGL